MMFGLPPVRLVAYFRASAMGIKPKSPGSVATVSSNVAAEMAAGNMDVIGTGFTTTNPAIVGGHAYAVLGYNSATGLFTIFNPWNAGAVTTYDGHAVYGSVFNCMPRPSPRTTIPMRSTSKALLDCEPVVQFSGTPYRTPKMRWLPRNSPGYGSCPRRRGMPMLSAMLAACVTLIFVGPWPFLTRPWPVAWHASFGAAGVGRAGWTATIRPQMTTLCFAVSLSTGCRRIPTRAMRREPSLTPVGNAAAGDAQRQ